MKGQCDEEGHVFNSRATQLPPNPSTHRARTLSLSLSFFGLSKGVLGLDDPAQWKVGEAS
jgi:hypothetical protein